MMQPEAHPLAASGLLTPADPAPFSIINPGGTSPFLITADHAGNAVPSKLDSLGLEHGELSRHIGWDIGVGELGTLLANAMDAVFIRQTYSRLVVDCNRRPDASDALPEISDRTPVPGNWSLTDEERAMRFAEIHEPYQQAIARELEERRCAGRPTVMVSLHSFTPAMRGGGAERPWQIAVLHHRGDTSFALRLLDVIRAPGDLIVGDNQPYAMDGVGYTMPRHAYPDRIPYAEFEIRQDLMLDPVDLERWSGRLSQALQATLAAAQEA